MTMKTDDRLWTVEQLAEYLGVPTNTIYKWRTRGEGPHGFKVGKHVRYRRTDVDAWWTARADGWS